MDCVNKSNDVTNRRSEATRQCVSGRLFVKKKQDVRPALFVSFLLLASPVSPIAIHDWTLVFVGPMTAPFGCARIGNRLVSVFIF